MARIQPITRITIADRMQRDGPLLLINTSDLGHGVRFSFVQEYFDLPCSDLVTDGDISCADRPLHRYARFVDSGITDNLGPRALLVTADVVGAPAAPALPR